MQIHSQELKAVIAAVKPALPSRSSIPILQSVLVSKNKATAYNLDVGIIATIDSCTDIPFLLPQKAIDLIPKLPDDDISIEIGNAITIRCGDIKTSYPISDPSDYPEIDMDDRMTEPVMIDGKWFRSAVDSTMYAASKTDEKPAYKGVLLDCKDGFLNVVGCDGRRLAWAKTAHDGEFKFIVPPEALKPLLSMSGDVNIRHSMSQVIFECADISVVSRLLAGEYLAYAQAIPQNTPHKMIVDRKQLCNALDRIAILSDKKELPITVIQIKDGTISLSINESMAQHTEEIQAQCTEPLRIGFNHRYLKDSLDHMQSDEIEVAYDGPLSPFTITSKDDAGFLALVLAVGFRDGR